MHLIDLSNRCSTLVPTLHQCRVPGAPVRCDLRLGSRRYTPRVTLQSDQFKQLARYAWAAFKNSGRVSFKSVSKTKEFEALMQQFKASNEIVLESVRCMVADLRKFPSHDYIVEKGRIGYLEHDTVKYNIVHGYMTMFAHFKEHDQGNVEEEELNEAIKLQFRGGGFSYALIPKRYQFTFGVTGTLTTLSKGEIEVLEEHFGLKNRTVVPSVYGQQNLTFEYESKRYVRRRNLCTIVILS